MLGAIVGFYASPYRVVPDGILQKQLGEVGDIFFIADEAWIVTWMSYGEDSLRITKIDASRVKR